MGARVASLWGSFAGEGAAGQGRLGQGRVTGSLVAPPWLKYDVYDHILEDFAYIPLKLSDRIGQNLDLDGEEDSEHEYDAKKNLTPRKKSTNYAIIQIQKTNSDQE